MSALIILIRISAASTYQLLTRQSIQLTSNYVTAQIRNPRWRADCRSRGFVCTHSDLASFIHVISTICRA